MVYAARWRKCGSCPRWQFGRLPPSGRWLCVTCRLDRAEDAARQMAAKSGPYYTKWLEAHGPRGRPRNN